MAFLAAPIIPAAPDEPQGAGVIIEELVPPNTIVLTSAFLAAPTISNTGDGGAKSRGYAME